jgi:lysozyme
MDDVLRKRLKQAGAAGAIAVAGVLATWNEGSKSAVYRDPVGIPTVCAGITGPDVIPGKRYTPAECDALLAKHLALADAGVKRVIHVPLNEWQRAALIDFTFNAGEGKLAGSTMARKFNAGDYVGGCKQLYLWVSGTVKGRLVKLKGLVNRRAEEADLCLNWKNPA